MARPISESQTHREGAEFGVWPFTLAALGVSLGVMLLALWQTTAALVALWAHSDAYGHGFFIAPIAAWLIWRRREKLAVLAPQPAPVGLLVMFAACVAWLIGQAAGIVLLSQLAFVAILQSVILTMVGWRVVAGLLFPLLYLYLMVPFGDFLIPHLQDLTAVAVVESLRMLGIPVFIDGILLSIPTGSFEISEACAGLRFMIAIFALGLVYAHLVYQSWRRRVAFMVLAMIVTLVASSLRALGIVYLAYVTNHEVAIGVDHLVYGWVFLSLVMLVLFLLGLTFRDRHVDVFQDTGPEPSHRQDRYQPPNALLVSCAIGTLLLVVATASYASRIEQPLEQSRPVALETPSAEPPWVQEHVSQTDWRPAYVNTDGELLVRYRSGDRTADLYLAFYAVQRQSAEVVNARNKLAADNQWVRLEDVSVDIELAGKELKCLGTIIQDISGRKRLVVRWFWIGGRATASPVLAKLFQVQAVILDQTHAAAAVLVSVPMEDDVETAMNTVRSLVAALPSLEATLARAAGLSAVSSDSAPAP